MITEREFDEYKKSYNRAATANPMTADCPPADEAASIRDDMVERIADDKMQEAIADPDYMAEMLLENDYKQPGFMEMAKELSAMMDELINGHCDPDLTLSIDARLKFAESMRDFIEMKSISIAEEQINES